MLKATVWLLIATVSVTYGVVNLGNRYENADKDFLDKQRTILELLRHVKFFDKESKYYKEFTELEAPKWENDVYMVSINESFSIYNDVHMRTASYLFKQFYEAKSWQSFYEGMLWAIHSLNCEMAVYAFTVALLHRKDMPGMELPAIYEIFPNLFFDSTILNSALKTVEMSQQQTLNINFNELENNAEGEQKLAYFTEDIAWNAYYYYLTADYPYWLGGEEYNLKADRRDELIVFEHQQLLSRYYMERLANGLGEIQDFDMVKYKTGHTANLMTNQNEKFTNRPDNISFKNRDRLENVELWLKMAQATNSLGALWQHNIDSDDLNFNVEGTIRSLVEQGLKGPLGHTETCLRDPLFYSIQKKLLQTNFDVNTKPVLSQFDTIESLLEKDNYLVYSGAEIIEANVDQLTTYFDEHNADITNFFPVFGKKIVKATQMRLNHEPFEFEIIVKGNAKELDLGKDGSPNSVVRIFMAPKLNAEYEMRRIYYLMDTFAHDIVEGRNVIKRNSRDFTWFVRDRTPYYALYQWVMNAINGVENFPLDMTESHCGLPQRLMLPNGKSNMEMEFFVIITKFKPPTIKQNSNFNSILNCGVGSGARYVDDLPFNFPFNLNIPDVYLPKLPNIFVFTKRLEHTDSPKEKSPHRE